MSADDDDLPEQEEAGMPGWVMTFADLMSLLMCFFVLLLSFSEMDLAKFKQVAGSMERAFGVQRVLEAKEAPRGTSIIAQEFSPGKPDPTPLNEIRQSATREFGDLLQIDQEANKKAEAAATEMAEELIEEIRDGKVEVETEEDKIIIRILEEGSFPSGSANLQQTFVPVLEKIGGLLVATPGSITVSGYTDNVPIATDLFRSNWELSAARSVSVVEKLLENEELDSRRFVVSGYAENRPLVVNDSDENRAKNRRVELVIAQGDALDYADQDAIDVSSEQDLEEIPSALEEALQEGDQTFVPVEDAEGEIDLIPLDEPGALSPEELLNTDEGLGELLPGGEISPDFGVDNPYIEQPVGQQPGVTKDTQTPTAVLPTAQPADVPTQATPNAQTPPATESTP